MNRMTELAFTRLTTVLLGVFPFVVVLLNVVNHDHYSGVSQAMSELALGPGGWLMAVAFTSMGVGIILVARGIRVAVPRARVVPGLLTIVGTLGIVSAIFRTNGEGQPDTTSSTIHLAAGLSMFLLMIVVLFTAAFTFRRDADWRWFAGPTLVWAVLALAAFFLVPILGDAHFGLAQRSFVAVWLSWLLTMSVLLRRPSAGGAARMGSAAAVESAPAR